jgi:MFS family permease
MLEPASARLTRHRSFVLFWCARTFSNGAFMMQGVAVGWQLYDLTNNPLDLGLVGLVQFFPLIALALVIGQVADRCDRRLVAAVSQVGKALAALILAIGTFQGWLGRDAMLGVLLFSGTARAFEMPTMHAMVSGIVPPLLLPRAIAASATAQQTAVICGPSIGGLLYTFGPTTVYVICAAIFLAASVLISLVHPTLRNDPPKPVSFENLFAGFRYIRHTPVVLGAISLDLFAVLLGGVTALLPIYARDILEAGPWALGLLRSSPALGALIMSVALARRAIEGRAGTIMFVAVGTFGLASIAFALSTSIVISCLALTIYGAADAVSVVIRQSLIQLRTPYDMLGRVLSVNSMFSGSSGSLGEFRAGVVAAWLGAVPSALIGGVGAVVVMLVWMWAFPQLRHVDRLAPNARNREGA